jgi:XTP/dITP diphosphohydrolase
MDFILASLNTHKLEELKNYFAPLDFFNLKLAPEKISVEETGSTYYENAHLKAKAYYQKFKKPTLADDSGINVTALPDELGIHSSRFGGGNLTDLEKNKLLLSKLSEEREASFTCVLCFYLNPQEIFFFEGNLKGKIATDIKGEKGFGYDPVFIPEENDASQSTLAMIPEWKADNSHRAKACASAVQFFRERDGQS